MVVLVAVSAVAPVVLACRVQVTGASVWVMGGGRGRGRGGGIGLIVVLGIITSGGMSAGVLPADFFTNACPVMRSA